MSFYNSLEPRAEKERNHSQPRAEEKGSITSNLVRKSEEVTRSSRTLKPRAEEEHQFIRNPKPRAEEEGTITPKSHVEVMKSQDRQKL